MAQAGQTVGAAVRAALAQRGWTQDDFARITGRARSEINFLIAGKRGLSAEMARDLAAALGGTAKEWLDLENERQLSLIPDSTDGIAKRARAYDLAPIKDMEKRGWLSGTDDPKELEAQVCAFFDMPTLDEEPMLHLSARKRSPTSPPSKEERAWAFRARAIARHAPAAAFDAMKLDALEKKLRRHAAYPHEAAEVPRLLARHGIRFVVIEAIAGAPLDGAAFWLDDKSPVIALSFRFDRNDNFWFTLCHEVAHIRNRDAWSVDSRLVGEARVSFTEESERRANADAAAMLIDPQELDSFIKRVGPLYSKERIVQFANRIKIHPGVIVGQLHHRDEAGWGANREMLVPVRDCVLKESIVDGWGRVVGTA